MLIYYTKLKNLFTAHQETYSKLLHENPGEVEKAHLKELLRIFQKNIKKLLIKKNEKSTYCHKRPNLGSTFFKLKHEKNSLLVKKPNSYVYQKKYFIKKPIQHTKESINWSQDEWFGMIKQIDNKLKTIDEKETSQITQENNNDNSTDNQEIYSNGSDVPNKTFICDGHGKSLNEKNEFIKIIGLVHKNDYQKIVNCKKSRKRRTTANPQFSHAAIEAKRITKLEIANERKNRRQLALEKQNKNNNETLNTFFSGPHQNYDDYDSFKFQNVFKDENELFPSLYVVENDLNIEQSCKICSEKCRFVEDTIVICQNCLSSFHINCLEQRFIFLDDIVCLICNFKRFGYNPITQKLMNIRQYISLLSRANYCLKLIFEKKKLERKQLCDELNEMLDKINRIRNIFMVLNNINISDQKN